MVHVNMKSQGLPATDTFTHKCGMPTIQYSARSARLLATAVPSVHKFTESAVNLTCTLPLLMFQTANLLQLICTGKKTMDGLRVKVD